MTGTGAVIDQNRIYTMSDEQAFSFISEYMNHYVSFIEGVKGGLEDYRQGKLRPWPEIKKELGYA